MGAMKLMIALAGILISPEVFVLMGVLRPWAKSSMSVVSRSAV